MKTITMKFPLLLMLGISMSMESVAFAQSRNNQQLTSDVTNLQQKLGKIQQDMSKLNRLLDNRAMLELFQRMDDLSQEVSDLRGMLEEQTHDLTGLKKRQRELYLDTDRRLRELEITSSRAPAANAPLLTDKPTETPSVNQQNPMMQPPAATKTDVPVTTVSPTATRPATVSTSSKPTATVSEERAAYQKAFDMLKEGRYKMANSAFNDFLQRYPASSYAGNAQYWLGESNYVTRNFKQAVEEFQQVLKKYPGSNKVPDAMLKLGYTHYELHEYGLAKSMLNQLRKNYSKSTAARLAGKRLERMNKEGH